MKLQLVSDSGDCVSLEELKSFLRLDFDDQDAMLLSLITSARTQIENHLGRTLMSKTYDAWFDSVEIGSHSNKWWDGTKQGAISEIAGNQTLNLGMANVESITDVKSYGQGNDELVYPSNNYFLDDVSQPCRLVLNHGSTWPSDLRQINSLKVRFVAGYGATANLVPSPLVTAVKMYAAYMYENDCEDEMLPKTIANLINHYRVMML